MAFTFKEHKSEGKYRSFYPSWWDIKLQKKVCGGIYVLNSLDRTYEVQFMVKKERTEKDPAPFKWVTLKEKFSDISEAKEFLKEHTKEITTKFDLHFLED
jgi:hypothetical protein